MMRIKSGILCALSMSLAFAVACADSPGSGDDQQGGGSNSGAVCGDGTCASSEVGYCPTDCGQGGNNNNAVCGNGMCESTKGETASTCFSDCGGGGGSGSGGNTSGTCPTDPNACIGCLLDPTQCPAGLDANSCLTCVLNGGGLGSGLGSGLGGSGLGDIGCTGGAPDGTCDSMESSQTCPSDCP